MDRTLWKGSFDPDSPPKFPCPECGNGKLQYLDGTRHLVEPQHSKNDHSHDAWEVDWIRERFQMMLQCNDKDCGEIVVVSGDTSIVEAHEEGPDGYEQVFITAYNPKTLFPAPPMISTPDGAPDDVIAPLKEAYALYWIDPGAGAARVRVSLERVLDEKLVPTEGIGKDGKKYELDLNGRIQAFEKTNPEEGETFHALRMVGNLGAHGDPVSEDTFLDVLELYEDALEKLYNNKKEKLKAIQEKILASKGKV